MPEQIGGTRAERMYNEFRPSGSKFWSELGSDEKAVWVAAAADARRAEAAEARVAELEAALQEALLGLTRAREREAENDQTDESMGITLALNRHINAVQIALKEGDAK